MARVVGVKVDEKGIVWVRISAADVAPNEELFIFTKRELMEAQNNAAERVLEDFKDFLAAQSGKAHP